MTLWTVARQAPLYMGFSRQECCSGLPFPPPGDLPNPGIDPRSPALQVDSSPSEPPGKPSRMDTQHQKPFSPWKKSHWLCSRKQHCPPHSLASGGMLTVGQPGLSHAGLCFLQECHKDEGTVRNSLTAVMLRISNWNLPSRSHKGYGACMRAC